METQNQVNRNGEVIDILHNHLNLTDELVDEVHDSQCHPDSNPSDQNKKWVTHKFWLVLVKCADIVTAGPHGKASDHGPGFDVFEDMVDPVEFVFQGQPEDQPYFCNNEGESEWVKVGFLGNDDQRQNRQD